VHLRFAPTIARAFLLAAAIGGGLASAAISARAEAVLLIDTDSGRVLHADNAGYPWYPASISKIMTTYVTLRAVKEGRIKLDTLISVSENALSQQPSKMGFPVGTRLTVDNALTILMVKSANDIAVVLAEGVSGSVEAFADEMNKTSARLGMTQSSWVNPNGLPADGQITSARDMAILARTMIREFPQYAHYWHTPSIKFGRRVMRNYNKLIDRYPGADGMKTGFICASGYNMVATATRNGKRLIAVVLGSSSGTQRAETAARLLEQGFQSNALAWLTPSLGSVEAIPTIAAAPPNLRDEICGKGRRNRTDHAEEEQAQAPGAGGVAAFTTALTGLAGGAQSASLIGPLTESAPPKVVSVIPPKGTVADLEASMNRPRKGRRGKAVAGKGKGRQTATIAVGDKPAAGTPKAGAKVRAGKPAGKPAAAKPASGKEKSKGKAKSAAATSNPKP
jgi:D-alanyl-D-alanine carboxypeptidase